MIATNPITIDGKTYDRLTVSFALTTRLSGGVLTGSCAVRLTPSRATDEGGQEELPDLAQSLIIGDTAEEALADPDVAAAVSAIAAALQTYITVKGL